MFDTTPVLPHALRVAPVRVRHRREVIRWALARRHPVNRDALASIIATRVIDADGSISTLWSVDDVDSLLMWGIDNWCRARGAAVPQHIASTLDSYLLYLSANNVLDDRSDPLASLRRAVSESGVAESRSDRTGHPSLLVQQRLAPVLPIG